MPKTILRYHGDARHPERRGIIPGLTPTGRAPLGDDPGEPAGLAPGTDLNLTNELMASLGRDTDPETVAEYAEFVAGVYNANLPFVKWEAIAIPDPAPSVTTQPVRPSPNEIGLLRFNPEEAPDDTTADEPDKENRS